MMQYTEVKQMQGNVREFDEYDVDSVQRAPKLHENAYYNKGRTTITEERTQKKTKSKTRHM